MPEVDLAAPGQSAVRAALAVRAARSEASGKLEDAASQCAELARLCATDSLDLHAATEHALHSLQLKDDSALRLQLSEWLESMGELEQAWSCLGSTPSSDGGLSPGHFHRRRASLAWRMGQAGHAAKELERVAELEPNATDSLDALAAFVHWAPEEVGPDRAVSASLEVARRCRVRGARLAAFEAVLRAHEIDPASLLAAEELALELRELGRADAADEVLRQSALAAENPERHRALAQAAWARRDWPKALAAFLDAGDDRSLDPSKAIRLAERWTTQTLPGEPCLDGVLLELRLFDWFVARLELALCRDRSPGAATGWLALARFCATVLGNSEAARQAVFQALLVSPLDPRVQAALLGGGSPSGEPVELVRAWVQAVRVAPPGETQARLAELLREQCEQGQGSHALAAWLGRLPNPNERAWSDGAMDPEAERRWAGEKEEYQKRIAYLAPLRGDARRAELWAIERWQSLDPAQPQAQLHTLVQLLEAEPTARRTQDALVECVDVLGLMAPDVERDARILGALDVLAAVAPARSASARTRQYLRRDRPEVALDSLASQLDQADPAPAVVSQILVLARQLGKPELAARALHHCADRSTGRLRAVLDILVAEMFLAAGSVARARSACTTPARGSDVAARHGSFQVELARTLGPREVVGAMDRVLGVIPLSVRIGRMLGRAHHVLGEPDLALAWMHRAAAIRVGDPVFCCDVLEAALLAHDAARVTDRLLHFPDEPVPVSSWLTTAATGLAWLAAVDGSRAAQVARRILERVGASDPSLRAALLEAARCGRDEPLAIDVLERAAAAAKEPSHLDFVLCERRRGSGDFEGAVHGALRALRRGDPGERYKPLLAEDCSHCSADAHLERLELRCALLTPETEPAMARVAWRELGGARLALADDQQGAVDAWTRASDLDPETGPQTLARDLTCALGLAEALAVLERLALGHPSPGQGARLLGCAAELCRENSAPQQCIEWIERALQLAPERTELLLVAENAALQAATPDVMHRLETLYERVSEQVLGVFGSRALHYRAACTLERFGDSAGAVRHLARAFEAVPTEGSTLQLLGSLTRRLGWPRELVEVVSAVAEREESPEKMSRWYSRALDQLGRTDEDLRERFDLLVKILVQHPHAGVVREVSGVLGEMHHRNLDDLDLAWLRLDRALSSQLGRLEGPDGARLALAVVQLTAPNAEKQVLTRRFLLAALGADAGIDEYRDLLPETLSQLLVDPQASSLLDEMVALAERPYSNVGQPAIELLACWVLRRFSAGVLPRLHAILRRSSDFEGWLSFAVEQLQRGELDPTAKSELTSIAFDDLARIADSELCVSSAKHLLQVVSPEDAPQQLAGELSWPGLLGGLIRWHLLASELKQAQAVLERWGSRLTPGERVELVLEVERRRGDPQAIEVALVHLAQTEGTSPSRAKEAWVEAAHLAQRNGRTERALELWVTAAERHPNDPSIQIGYAAALHRTGRFSDPMTARVVLPFLAEQVQPQSREQEIAKAFLLSEALSAMGQQARAMDVLLAAHASLSPCPLLALSLAQGAAREQDHDRAVMLFAEARAGDWLGFHSDASAGLLAARALLELGEREAGLEWLEAALADPATRPDALILRGELRRDSAQRQSPLQSALAHAPVQPIGVEAREEARPDPVPERPVPTATATDRESPPMALRGVPVELTLESPDGSLAELATVEEALAFAATHLQGHEQQPRRLELGRGWLRRWPASAPLLRWVRGVLEQEGDARHSLALTAALTVLEQTGSVDVPELAEQPINADAVRSILLAGLDCPEVQVLAILWEDAGHLFRKEISDYGMTGMARVVPGSPSPVARILAEVQPRFGMVRTPVFHRKNSGDFRGSVALLHPASALLDGNPGNDERILAYRIGECLLATLPEHALLFGLSSEALRHVLLALRLSFGPPNQQPTADLGSALQLGKRLWESVRTPSQRILRELCREPLEIGRVRDAGVRALRRAGLYVCGDLQVALRLACQQEGIVPVPQDSTGWEGLCRAEPHVLDLCRLATSAEYAGVRWETPRGGPSGSGARAWTGP